MNNFKLNGRNRLGWIITLSALNRYLTNIAFFILTIRLVVPSNSLALIVNFLNSISYKAINYLINCNKLLNINFMNINLVTIIIAIILIISFITVILTKIFIVKLTSLISLITLISSIIVIYIDYIFFAKQQLFIDNLLAVVGVILFISYWLIGFALFRLFKRHKKKLSKGKSPTSLKVEKIELLSFKSFRGVNLFLLNFNVVPILFGIKVYKAKDINKNSDIFIIDTYHKQENFLQYEGKELRVLDIDKDNITGWYFNSGPK